MSNTPLPEDAKPTDKVEEPEAENETVAMVKELAAAKARWKPNAKHIGLGAAAGVGSAAIVAGLLYWRGNRK